MTLTNEQRKFVHDNHGLLFSFLQKRGLPIWESDQYNCEDWYGTAAIGLCKAAATYDANEVAAFSTYAFKCMNNEILHRYSEINRQKRIPSEKIRYGDAIISYEDDSFTLFDTIANPDYSEEYLILKTDFERQLSKENERTRAIMRFLAQGYTLNEVGNLFGLTRERVRQIKDKFVKKMGYE